MFTMSETTRLQLVRYYVAATVAAAVVAVFLAAQIDFAFTATTDNLLRIFAFSLLAFLTTAIESTSTVGVHGSVAFVSHLAAVVVLGPVGGAIVAGSSMAVAQTWLKRSFSRILFNVGQIVLSTAVGGALYVVAGGHTQPAVFLDRDLVAYAVLVVAYFTINSGAVSGVVALNQGVSFADTWRVQLMKAAGYDLVASALGLLVAWMYLRFGFLSIVAVTLPILALRQAYRDNLDLKKANAELERRHRELLDFTVKQIEARDPYTSGHSRRVSEYARIIAIESGLSSQEAEEVTTAALLHDVGKVYHEFGTLLQKEGRLTAEEKLLLQSHPIRSAELIATISNLRGRVELDVKHHHENYDGTGYPDGLRGESIPIGSRIIMIADTLDAMTTDRPYRSALSFDRVLDEFRKYSGRQFDPKLAELAIKSHAIRQLVGGGSTPNPEPIGPLARSHRAWIRVRAKASESPAQ
jgi:HD-GYP domain-containing protein (c-di-GMP phosphodiesterase class II)